MRAKDIVKLVTSIVVCELAGVIGSLFTTPAIPGWYQTLVKPSFQPPAWLFAPVWTTLFVLMGIAAFLIWKRGLERKDVKVALGIFIVQLVLNTLWSIIFFGQQNPGGALVEIIFLWLAILATIITFAKISKAAAWLLVPYILWVSFAGFLNYTIWRLNINPVAASQISYENWTSVIDDQAGVSFKYPNNLLTEYISTVDWPPQVQVVNEPFTCTAGGSEIARAGITESRTVDNRAYCVTRESKGAAGSVYTMYAYAWASGDKTVILTFSLRFGQCGNYDEPKKTACANERSAFDMDSTVDRMAASVSGI